MFEPESSFYKRWIALCAGKTSSTEHIGSATFIHWMVIYQRDGLYILNNLSLLFILKQVFFLCSWHPRILLSCSELNGSKKCWDSQTSHNERTSTKWTHLFQGKFFCSQMQNFVQFLPLWSKNLSPSGVHIREISPNYNTTLLDQVLILLETFLGREVHMPPVWISICGHFAFLVLSRPRLDSI